MEHGHTFWELLLGTTDYTAYAVSFVLALIGAFFSLRFQVAKRNKNSPETPQRFSVKFMLADNAMRLLTTVLLIFIGLKFSQELLGAEVTQWGAIVIGLSLDKVSEFLKNQSSKARK